MAQLSRVTNMIITVITVHCCINLPWLITVNLPIGHLDIYFFIVTPFILLSEDTLLAVFRNTSIVSKPFKIAFSTFELKHKGYQEVTFIAGAAKNFCDPFIYLRFNKEIRQAVLQLCRRTARGSESQNQSASQTRSVDLPPTAC